jgi:hypothetical protein
MSDTVITLKWGTLKGWEGVKEDSEARKLLEKYHDQPVSWGVAQQRDTPEQKQALIDLVSLSDVRVYLDWNGKYVSNDEAVKYLTEYGKESTNA